MADHPAGAGQFEGGKGGVPDEVARGVGVIKAVAVLDEVAVGRRLDVCVTAKGTAVERRVALASGVWGKTVVLTGK